jgi:hypothetical protein
MSEKDTMTQETFPEVQAATKALEQRIAATEVEINEMKEDIAGRKQLVRAWRKAISAVNPKPPGQKQKAAAV